MACANAITAIVTGPSPPANADDLRDKRDEINTCAQKVGDAVLSDIDASLPAALNQLKGQIDAATKTLKEIKQAQMIANLAADILAAAAGVATGGVIAGAPAIMTLVKDLSADIDAANKPDDNKSSAGSGADP
jgi:hypothetical protein